MKIINIKKLIVAVALIFAGFTADAQISGSFNVCPGSSYVYGVEIFGFISGRKWTAVGGTIQGSSTGYSCTVIWSGASGTKQIKFQYWKQGQGWTYLSSNVFALTAGSPSSNQTVCSGSSGSVSVSGGTANISNWEKQTWNGSSWSSWSNITGTSTTYNYSNLTQTTRFRIEYANCGLYSNYTQVTVNAASVGGTISGSGNRCNSGSATLTLSGHTGSVQKWQKREEGQSTWSDISGSGGSTSLATGTVSESTDYRAQVKSGVCGAVYSSTGYITIDSPSAGGTTSGGTNHCNSGSGTITLSGQNGLVQKWQKRVNGGSWQNVTNNTSSLSYSNITADTEYRAEVKMGSCAAAYSSISLVNIDPVSVGGTTSGGGTYCGSASRTITLSGHTGTVVSWEKRVNSGSWVSAGGSGSTSISTGTITADTDYRALVKSGVCSNVYSSTTSVNIDPVSVGGTISGGGTYCASASGSLSLSGHTGSVQKWQKRENGGSWVDISNTSTSQSISGVTVDTDYRAYVKSGVCSAVYSNIKSVNIDATTVGGTVSGGTTACSPLSASLGLSGNVGSVVRWEYSTNGGSSWTHISNTTTSISVFGITQDREYRALVDNGVCSSQYSSKAYLYVDDPTVGGTTSGGGNFCASGSGTVTLSGHTGSIVKWQKNVDGGGWTDIANTTTTQSYSGITDDTDYRAEIKSGVCSALYSSITTVNIDPTSVGGTVSGGATLCSGSNASLTLAGHTGTVSRWEYSTDGGSNWNFISNTSTSYNPTNITTTTKYKAYVQSGVCSGAYSTEATVNIDAASVGGTASGVTAGCVGTGGSVSVAGYTGTIEAWQVKIGVIGGSYSDISGTSGLTTYNYTPSSQNTYRYRARIKNGVCADAYSTDVAVLVEGPEAGDISYTGTNNTCGSTSGTLSFTNFYGTLEEIESSTDGSSWSTYHTFTGGATTHPIVVYGETRHFRGVVSDGLLCDDANTSTVVITSYGASNAGTIGLASGSQAVYLESGSGTLEETSSTTNGSLQWQQSIDNGTTYTDISGATGSSYSFSVTDTTMYRIKAQIQSCAIHYSDPFTIEVRGRGQVDVPLAAAYGEKVTMEVDNLVGDVLEWEVSFDGGTTFEVLDPNANKPGFGNSYDFNILEDTTLFRAQVAVTGFGTYYSDTATIVMNQSALPQTNWDQVKQTAVLEAVSTEGQIPTTSTDTTVVTQVFADGLGRHLQSLTLSASPDENDITQISVYDKYGRQSKGYMAYTRSGTINNKIDIDDLLAEQSAFYDNSLDDITDSDVPYSEVVYDDSPLQRIEESGAPGDTWKIGGGHTVKYDYRTNTATEVREWTEAGVSNGFYRANELWVSQVTDENGNKALSFTDKSGRTIQQRRQIDATEWAITAHIYDALGRMKYTISPEGMNNVAVSGTVTLTAAFIDDWVFEYTYDDLGRVTEKKVPGAEAQYFVYDNLDRVVLTQDGNMRDDDQWTYIKYDELHRPIMTGLYTNATTTTLSGMQALLDAETVHNEGDSTANHGYTNQAFPTTGTEVLTVSYYDDYDFDNNGTDDYSYIAEGVTPEPVPFTRTRGLATGGKVKILETGTWLESAVFYDKYGRVIQAQAENHYGGTDKVTTQFDFAGRALKSWQYHHTATDTISIVNRFVYDHVGRVLEQYQTFEDESELLLVSYTYNDLGQLIDKKLHSDDNGTTFEQSLDLTYNIRGWVTGINDAALSGSDGDLWGMELAYDEAVTGVTTTKMYNGNISAVKWSTGQETTSERAYAYSYDKMNRFTEAQHYAKETSWSSKDDFSVDNLAYDHNGNIEALRRRHWDGSTMDSLTYTYDGNKLLTVADGALNIGFNDGNTSGDDYLYDANGNMTEDKNKGLDSIQYNFMNLPVKVVKSDSTYQKYTYSAAGGKLVVESFNKSDSLLARTDYLGAFIYKDSVLQSIEHSEGRIIPGITAGTWEHQYHIKDHQGNNRLTFTTAPNTFEYLATMETSRSTLEESYFSNIDDTGVSVASYINHTPTSIVPSPSRAIRINNAVDNPQKVIGAAIPLQVFPGDTIKAEVFAKYQNYSSTNDDAIGSMATFMAGAFGLPTVNGESQEIFDFMEGAPFLGLAAWNDLDETVPRAYLNYILLDKNFNFVDFGFEQVSSSAEIPGSNPSSHSHEKLSFDLPITEEGYIYLYVSNESQNNADVYFDDFKVTHVESKVVQTNDFYPFGLAAESFSRLSNIPNKFLYNAGAELNEISGNYETFYRHYDPVLGRFNSIDPLASSFVSLTPYQYANNDPVLFNDPLGDRFAREHEFLPSATPSDGDVGRGGGAGGYAGRRDLTTEILGQDLSNLIAETTAAMEKAQEESKEEEEKNEENREQIEKILSAAIGILNDKTAGDNLTFSALELYAKFEFGTTDILLDNVDITASSIGNDDLIDLGKKNAGQLLADYVREFYIEKRADPSVERPYLHEFIDIHTKIKELGDVTTYGGGYKTSSGPFEINSIKVTVTVVMSVKGFNNQYDDDTTDNRVGNPGFRPEKAYDINNTVNYKSKVFNASGKGLIIFSVRNNRDKGLAIYKYITGR